MYDVIGAGSDGLSSAAKLSKEGSIVPVPGQHSVLISVYDYRVYLPELSRAAGPVFMRYQKCKNFDFM